jgi:glucokinase
MNLQHSISCKKAYLNYEHTNFIDIFDHYRRDHHKELKQCQRCCIAVAGPVKNGVSKLTNLSWQLDVEELRQLLPFEQVELINDFHALGYCIPLLTPDALLSLQQGKAIQHSMKIIVGAGTGLGVAHVKQEGHEIEVYPSEGGHVDFAPVNRRQIALLEFLMQKYQHVSVEHLLSGHGIEHLFEFICHENNTDFCVDSHTASDISGQKIINLAMEQQQPLAIEAIRLFSEIYASFIGNLALHNLPYGGVYIAGGIARHILPYLRDKNFIQAYSDKGRLSSVLQDIPIHYILNTNANLLGAGYYLNMQHDDLRQRANVLL